MKRRTLALIAPMFLLLVGAAAPTEPTPEPLAARVTTLETEVDALEGLVAEQGRRIAALEQRLATAQPAPASGASPGPPAASAPASSPEVRAQPGPEAPPWARAESWRAIHAGMTEKQVREILGEPSATREIGFSRRLIYRGEVPGSGFLRGTVKLQDGKVSDVEPPNF